MHRFSSRFDLVPWCSRVLAYVGMLVLVGMLPWISQEKAELMVLRSRYAELAPTAANLEALRTELHLDQGPIHLLRHWIAGLVRGDLGLSWVSGAPVAGPAWSAFLVSLTLMGFAMLVAFIVVLVILAPQLHALTTGKSRKAALTVPTLLTSFPSFLIAVVLVLVLSIWLKIFPPLGFSSWKHAVLPSISLGVPAGGVIARLLSDSLQHAAREPWVRSWLDAGAPRLTLLTAVLRRALAPVVHQIALVIVAVTGGAVPVEEIFAIPGIGRFTLWASKSQDIPSLQAGVLLLFGFAAIVGVCAQGIHRLLLGAAAKSNVPVATPEAPRRSRDLLLPIVSILPVVLCVILGLGRHPYSLDHPRLQPPSWALPLGSDAAGRDVLGRLAYGAAITMSFAMVVTVLCIIIALLASLMPRWSAGLVDVTNATSPVLAGLLVAGVAGPSMMSAAIAVALASWAPLAAHARDLLHEAKLQPYITMLPTLGESRASTYLRFLLPQIAGPLLRHSFLRMPGKALALASLGFLGMGPQQPTPEWGAMLAEGLPYVEQAPWIALAPTFALILLSMSAQGFAALPPAHTRRLGSEAQGLQGLARLRQTAKRLGRMRR